MSIYYFSETGQGSNFTINRKNANLLAPATQNSWQRNYKMYTGYRHNNLKAKDANITMEFPWSPQNSMDGKVYQIGLKSPN